MIFWSYFCILWLASTYWNPRNHPKLFSQKSWYLGIRNGPIVRGFWNLNQSIEQNGKNLQLEKCIIIKGIKITFWDTAQYFHRKQLRKSFEKIFLLKFVEVGYKRKKKFFQINTSFTKCTSPAKLFLNNSLFYLLNFFSSTFGIFVVMKPAERSVK